MTGSILDKPRCTESWLFFERGAMYDLRCCLDADHIGQRPCFDINYRLEWSR